MAESARTARGSFWIWATLVILVAVIVVAWLSARDNAPDPGQTIPPVETGAAREPAPSSGGARLAALGVQRDRPTAPA